MRKALIVGINEYFGNELTCCVNDAKMIESLLSDIMMVHQILKQKYY